ncbi:molybdopterin-dependent oxidoreductase [Lapillicoccus jejuensis]|uniref:Molybdopterin-dependent oxidoreductase-like protein n=1 Tax=Lapillicoccus jejuensis TaxID=402171 RepID=A0A542E2H5_9MICO|nr:molybdopterin-dependent oxidoreductase [Lapillicoccus jejuensis]TQJ09489.1 molybdopterin-dependent oxidoreductase-like protein [Lapillicoccus jejuensis]
MSPVHGPAGDRRWFLRGALGVGAATALLTAGSAVPALERVSLLRSRTPSRSPQGVPVNRTPAQAGVTAVDESRWRLRVVGPAGTREVGAADLAALPSRTVVLPIACVEGWSATATWTGVRVRDLTALVGATGQDLVVTSTERSGPNRVSRLPAAFADHDDTLVALRIDGVRLPLEHGFPARLIAPNRPGVLQTKWLASLEVAS